FGGPQIFYRKSTLSPELCFTRSQMKNEPCSRFFRVGAWRPTRDLSVSDLLPLTSHYFPEGGAPRRPNLSVTHNSPHHVSRSDHISRQRKTPLGHPSCGGAGSATF